MQCRDQAAQQRVSGRHAFDDQVAARLDHVEAGRAEQRLIKQAERRPRLRRVILQAADFAAQAGVGAAGIEEAGQGQGGVVHDVAQRMGVDVEMAVIHRRRAAGNDLKSAAAHEAGAWQRPAEDVDCSQAVASRLQPFERSAGRHGDKPGAGR